MHGLSAGRNEHDVVNEGTMEVDEVVVGLIEISWHETIFLEGVCNHNACCHAFFDFGIELFYAANADFLALVVAPDGQWSAPKTRAAQVPVVKIFEPLAEASRACRFGLPRNGLVELHHALLEG